MLPLLPSLAINLLGSHGFGSIRSGLLGVARGIARLLALGWMQLAEQG